MRQVISLKKIPFDSIKHQNDFDITIGKNKKVYIVSKKNLVARAFQDAFVQNEIATQIIEMDNALNLELTHPAGLVIIPDIEDIKYDDSYINADSDLEAPVPAGEKDFLKKAFLLAKRNAPYLMQAAAEECAFFTAISFLGGSFGFGDEEIIDPLQGALAGLVKTAALEWDGVSCKSIDMPMPFSIDHSIANAEIAVSLMLMRGPVEIGLKDGICTFPELITKEIPPYQGSNQNSPSLPLNQQDVIIITGGARGVTAECAVELASTFSPVIILIGRSPMPEPEPVWMKPLTTETEIKKGILTNLFNVSPPASPMELQKICSSMLAGREINQTLARIKSAGSTVKYYCTDIRNPENLNKTLQTVREEFGTISAIIHAAGILKDKFIVDKTEEQFTAVFDTKVEGMRNLLQSTMNDPLKYVIFFSSVAARTGNRGQVDYAMANEVLNKTAQFYSKAKKTLYDTDTFRHRDDTFRHRDKCKFISINWGPWEGGMVTPQLKKEFVKRGIELIPLREGAKSLVDELSQDSGKTEKSGKVEKTEETGKARKTKKIEKEVEIILGASLLESTLPAFQTGNLLNQENQNNQNNQRKEQHQTREINAIFSREQILAFAIGKPSEAFGEKYRPFDSKRKIARLPGPPYFFMDRIITADAPQWEMTPSGWIESQFDMPSDGWYFRAGYTSCLPFCILLEIALQPCGWLAAYAGSALKSQDRLYFRNLGGEAELIKPVHRDMGTLTMRSRMTAVSHAGGLIIQNFDMEVLKGNEMLYKGKTNFGFFTRQSLSNQAGIKNSDLHDALGENQSSRNDLLLNISERLKKRQDSTLNGQNINEEGINEEGINEQDINEQDINKQGIILFKNNKPLTPNDLSVEKTKSGMPSKALLMIDSIDTLIPDGGKYGKGFIQGRKTVDPDEWFFKAHFYQDPVCPGSLGVESFLQLMQFYALNVWEYDPEKYELVMNRHTHKWIYRGQIIPSCGEIRIIAHIKSIEQNKNSDMLQLFQNCSIIADGLLYVDDLCIYQMENFSLQLVPVFC